MKTVRPVDGKWGIELTSNEAVIKANLKTLKYYKEVRNIQHEDLELDIRGYEMILESNDPEGNAKVFLDIKQDAHLNKEFRNNIDVINHMKKRGLWNM